MSIKISFQCGCGFKTESAVKATEHNIEKQHTLTISGEIKTPKPEK